MHNQRGGILSKLFLIPVGVAFMAGSFLLGYFVGRHHSRTATVSEQLAPLPEIVAERLPRKEDFTFYKALTEKDNITISIDLRQKEESKGQRRDGEEKKAHGQPAPPQEAVKKAAPAESPKKEERSIEVRLDRPAAGAPVPAEAKPRPPSGSEAGQLRYTVQIASYPEREMAEQEVRRMKKRGYAAFVTANEIPERGTWYRVRVGSFRNRLSAEKLMNELKNKEGLSPFITIE